MTQLPEIRLPAGIDADEVLRRLGRVLDPELDESVLALGFVVSIHGEDAGDNAGTLAVELRLPTYWCAANFSYLMASDIQRELSEVNGVAGVRVRLLQHFAGAAIEAGTAPGMTFADAFPEGDRDSRAPDPSGPDSIEEIRQLFLRKGFFTRQEKLLRALKQSGLSFSEIASLRVADLRFDGAGCTIASNDRAERPVGDLRTGQRYLERRRELGLDDSGQASLIVDATGAPIPAAELETYYLRARTTRLAMEANGALCTALLQARRSSTIPEITT